jgi:hypothetical protein
MVWPSAYGFADGIIAFSQLGTPARFTRDVSGRALAQSFVNYIDSHPAEMDADNVDWVAVKAWLTDGILEKLPERRAR